MRLPSRVAEAVDGCGVEPVDALVKGDVDRLDRCLVVLRSPAELPAGAAHGPGVEPNRGELRSLGSQLARFTCRHLNLYASLLVRAPGGPRLPLYRGGVAGASTPASTGRALLGLPGTDAANSTTCATPNHRATVEQAALRAQAHSTRKRLPLIGAGSKRG